MKTPAENIYFLGPHRLMRGDSCDSAQVAALLRGNKAKLLICDPPYFLGRDKWDQFADSCAYLDFFARWLETAFKHLDPAGYNGFVFTGQKNLEQVRPLFRRLGVETRSVLIWHYRNRPQPYTQPRLGLKKTYDPIIHFGNRPLNLPRPPTDACFDVWTIAATQSNYKEGRIHPCQKPLALISRMIELGSQPGDIVLDLFGGSGTTLIAAARLGRICYLMERDPTYCRGILQRWRGEAGFSQVSASTMRRAPPISAKGRKAQLFSDNNNSQFRKSS